MHCVVEACGATLWEAILREGGESCPQFSLCEKLCMNNFFAARRHHPRISNKKIMLPKNVILVAVWWIAL